MWSFKESIEPFVQTEDMKKEFLRITGKSFEEADEADIQKYTDYLERLVDGTEKEER